MKKGPEKLRPKLPHINSLQFIPSRYFSYPLCIPTNENDIVIRVHFLFFIFFLLVSFFLSFFFYWLHLTQFEPQFPSPLLPFGKQQICQASFPKADFFCPLPLPTLLNFHHLLQNSRPHSCPLFP